MLEKKYRLSHNVNISQASTIHSSVFVLKVGKNKLDHSRFGFIVSKKVSEKAVIRNAIKRSIRSCIEKRLDKVKNGFDMLFIIKKTALNYSHDEIDMEVERQLQKVHVL